MKCERCDHPEADHCKGGKTHQEWKESQRQWVVTRFTVCVSRHCDQPVCSCVDFVAPEVIETPAEREAWLDAIARDLSA